MGYDSSGFKDIPDIKQIVEGIGKMIYKELKVAIQLWCGRVNI